MAYLIVTILIAMTDTVTPATFIVLGIDTEMQITDGISTVHGMSIIDISAPEIRDRGRQDVPDFLFP